MLSICLRYHMLRRSYAPTCLDCLVRPPRSRSTLLSHRMIADLNALPASLDRAADELRTEHRQQQRDLHMGNASRPEGLVGVSADRPNTPRGKAVQDEARAQQRDERPGFAAIGGQQRGDGHAIPQIRLSTQPTMKSSNLVPPSASLK